MNIVPENEMKHSKLELLSMGVIEYAEVVMKLRLSPWQKDNIERLQNNPLEADYIFRRKGNLYGTRACYLVYERWKNRISEFDN